MSLGLTESTLKELKKLGTVEVFDEVEADPSKKTLLKAIEIGKKLKQQELLVLVEDHQWM